MLEVTVFVCGAAVMILELVGARILAPYLGTSTVVWTGLIGVVLASLSGGYWWGGRLADRHPTARALSAIILVAAVLTGATVVAKFPLLEFLASQALGPRLAVLAATLLLFGPAAGTLGMVAPFAVRLALTDPARAGATAGRLYAVSTLGSIAGTFATGFYLIAALGNAAILLAVAAALLVLSLAVSRADWPAKAAGAALLAICALSLAGTEASLAAAGIVDADTAYGRLLVYQGLDPRTGRPVRALSTGPLRVQSSMFLDDPESLALSYTRFFDLGFSLVPQARRVLVLGGGGYSFPRYVLAKHLQAAVTVVELDPGVTALARQYFKLTDHPRLTIVHEDARTFCHRDSGPYDLIYLDAFGTDYAPPFHLVTREAMLRLKALLAPDGALFVNSIAAVTGEGSRLTRSLAATLATVFPEAALFPLDRPDQAHVPQNVVFLAGITPRPLPPANNEETRRFLDGRLPAAAYGEGGMVLGDDHAPVELMGVALWRDALR
jgi:spermidine synthase